MKKNIKKELKKMRIEFLEGAIRKKAFSMPVLGDFKQKLRKLKSK